jgi:prepilin-type N-terminal cleavage/methylation domain-containing protein
MNTWQAARRSVRGFSLTELMIVISIMGLLLAVSSPALSRFAANWRLNGAAATMAMHMRAARSTAVNKNIDVVFFFDQDAGEYYFLEDTNGNGVADGGERETGVQVLPSGVIFKDFTVPSTEIIFSSKGSTADGGTIMMTGRDGKAVQIRIYSGTGNVAVEKVQA